MGLTIHYSGKLKNRNALPLLIEEVKDIAQIMEWPYDIFETEFSKDFFDSEKVSDKIYGIQFTPPQCESVSMCFLSNGGLLNLLSFYNYIQSNGKDKDFLNHGAFVKTQFAGWQMHKTLIVLLRHLSQKYFEDFKVNDEADYWGTNDDELLKKKFAQMDSLLNDFKDTLENTKHVSTESLSDYMERVLKNFQKKNSDEE